MPIELFSIGTVFDAVSIVVSPKQLCIHLNDIDDCR